MVTTPESFVDALNSAFGKQTTQRAAHAKGVVLLGKFVPSAEAASVSKALHFKHEVSVTVRFSANSGIPKIADADPRAAPRGLAIRFRLPDGSDTDLVTHSYNGFPAKNPRSLSNSSWRLPAASQGSRRRRQSRPFRRRTQPRRRS
jgi:catalase